LFTIQIKKIFLHHAKTRIKFTGCCFVTKKVAAEKFQAVARRKNVNQTCRAPFHHEKSRRRKISSSCATEKRESNLQNAVSSRKKPPQENFKWFRDKKRESNLQGVISS
jgi:hypothetical protein